MDGQSKGWSLFETVASTAIGFVISLLSNIVILPAVGLTATFSQSFWMVVFFTFVSLLRGYCVRRLFNYLGTRYDRSRSPSLPS